jgi:hypothetical protein
MPSTEEYWRLSDGVGNWVFAAVCLVLALVLMRLILRERITLQGSMSYLVFLGALGGMAVFPDVTGRVAHALGFSTLANFFFCTAIAALAILHLRALVTLSRVHLRSIALTQELAILQERLDRLPGRLAGGDRALPPGPAEPPEHGP